MYLHRTSIYSLCALALTRVCRKWWRCLGAKKESVGSYIYIYPPILSIDPLAVSFGPLETKTSFDSFFFSV